jgi:hypothetical protein
MKDVLTFELVVAIVLVKSSFFLSAIEKSGVIVVEKLYIT